MQIDNFVDNQTERERAFEARAAEATAAAQQAQHNLAEERNRTAATLSAERSACDARVSQLNEELERVCQQLRDEQGRFAICSTEVQDAREELAALAELRAERDAVLRSRAQVPILLQSYSFYFRAN
jgi:chromosome segregation ATPase